MEPLAAVVEAAADRFQAPRAHRLGQRRQGHGLAGGPEGAGGVADVALRLAEVVGLV